MSACWRRYGLVSPASRFTPARYALAGIVAPLRSRALIWINFFFATVVVLGVFLEAYFIAAYASGAGEGALDAHSVTGGIVVHGSELLVFLSALVGFWGFWRWVGWSFLLLLVGTVQIFLAPPDEDPLSGWVHGLHGLLALVVLVIASVIAHHDLKLLRRSESARPAS